MRVKNPNIEKCGSLTEPGTTFFMMSILDNVLKLVT